MTSVHGPGREIWTEPSKPCPYSATASRDSPRSEASRRSSRPAAEVRRHPYEVRSTWRSRSGPTARPTASAPHRSPARWAMRGTGGSPAARRSNPAEAARRASSPGRAPRLRAPRSPSSSPTAAPHGRQRCRRVRGIPKTST
ncbi:hypothetical protein IOD13_10640 [Brevibacterium casei]|nr:hypothetical protein [Brevibacterium casei]